jgi:hypothetical protein
MKVKKVAQAVASPTSSTGTSLATSARKRPFQVATQTPTSPAPAKSSTRGQPESN